MSKYIKLLVLSWFAVSCSSDKPSEKQKEALVYKDGNIALLSHTTDSISGIDLKTFVADTAVNPIEEGIRTSFVLHITKEILDKVQQTGFDALLCDVTCQGSNGKKYSYLNTYLSTLTGQILYPDKHIAFSHEATRALDIDIPFRKLELAPGLQELSISFVIYPIKFTVDTNRVETKHIERIGSNPLYIKNYTTKVYTPTLTHSTITIKDLIISTQHKSASSYDFALGGSGLPDPYWQIWCGNELLYFSAPVKNTLVIKEPQTSSVFYTAPKDVITIKFLDYDNGPFNRDDAIETFSETVSELKKLKKLKGTTLSSASINLKQ